MIYIDTSSLLKLLFNEPESEAVRNAVAAESDVQISSLARLEAQIQLKAARLGGEFGRPKHGAYLKRLNSFGDMDPFHFSVLAGSVFETALKGDSKASDSHLRTLDRLHLAAMSELGITRLMTNDARQRLAAEQSGYSVIFPQARMPE